jgi:hypothetical protein
LNYPQFKQADRKSTDSKSNIPFKMACVDSDFSMMRDESDVEDDVFDMSDNDENVAPPSKGSKPAPKGSGKKVLASNNNEGNVPASEKGSKKTVEQMYQKKTQLEHILLRPDTYIGSVEPLTTKMFVFNDKTERMVNRDITYTPGLYKIFDESKFWKHGIGTIPSWLTFEIVPRRSRRKRCG